MSDPEKVWCLTSLGPEIKIINVKMFHSFPNMQDYNIVKAKALNYTYLTLQIFFSGAQQRHTSINANGHRE